MIPRPPLKKSNSSLSSDAKRVSVPSAPFILHRAPRQTDWFQHIHLQTCRTLQLQSKYILMFVSVFAAGRILVVVIAHIKYWILKQNRKEVKNCLYEKQFFQSWIWKHLKGTECAKNLHYMCKLKKYIYTNWTCFWLFSDTRQLTLAVQLCLVLLFSHKDRWFLLIGLSEANCPSYGYETPKHCCSTVGHTNQY